MKKYRLRTMGLLLTGILSLGAAMAQDKQLNEGSKYKVKPDNEKEIIIRPKSDKDEKVTVEIKDGQVFVNGKPVGEYSNADLSVEVRDQDVEKIILMRPGSPFRSRGGAWNFSGDMNMENRAFLGVASDKAAGGGAAITEVSSESAAEKAGLKKGDIIVKVDETSIDSPEDLVKTIRKYKPEDKVAITYKRDGKEQKVTATLGTNKQMMVWKDVEIPQFNEDFDLAPMPPGMPQNMPRPRTFIYSERGPKIGIKAQDLENGSGVKVLDVDEESPAAKAGIKEGDIITQYAGQNITSARQLAELSRANGVKSPVKLKITRGGKPMDIEVKIPRKLNTAEL